MSKYNKKGLYAGYKKNNKEREALDYYATPSEEVTNILKTLGIDFSNCNILEPCAGGGYMLKGIEDYLNDTNQKNVNIYATDLKDRGNVSSFEYKYGDEYDFLLDNYDCGCEDIDYVIMNPPYATIEPFVIRALEIAKKGVILLGRLQFVEGQKRYETIFKETPISKIYAYVDRIACYKNGDFSLKPDSIQAYGWFYFDKEAQGKPTEFNWIRRVDKL